MSNSSPLEDRGLTQLFELATPDLYRRNAFRILGLRVEAETGDARRKQKKLKRRKALGLGSQPSGSMMALSESVSGSDLQLAQQRIQDPVSRLLDEFFWFWATEDEGDDDAEEKEDEALKLLQESNSADAARLFEMRESRGDLTATHNLAVLHHLNALDLEERSENQPLNEAEKASRDAACRGCLPRWKKLLDDTSTWSRLRDRISELDDPRLTHDLVGQIRESLEEVVLLISARLAVKAAEENHSDDVSRHATLMRSAGFPNELVASAMRRCLWPIDLRIRNACQRADEGSDKEPRDGMRLAEGLLSDTLTSLRLIDQMVPKDDPLREGLHDEVAKYALRCQVVYSNKTDDWRSSKMLLSRLLTDLSPSVSMREKIEENLRIVSENLKFGMCYYCEDHQSVEGAAVEVPMHGDVQTTWTGYKTYRVTWRHLTVKVPRCPRCQANHDTMSTYSTLGGVLGFLLSVLIGYLVFTFWKPRGMDGGAYLVVGGIGLVGLFLVTWIGSLIGYAVGGQNVDYPMRGSTDYENQSSIAQLIREGWKYGSEPPS